MYIENLGEIKAVGFDIDGTLYRSIRLNIRMTFYVLFHLRTFLVYNKVRKSLHGAPEVTDFRKMQAEKAAEILKCEPEAAEKLLDKVIYKHMEKYFVNMKTCKDSIQLIKDLKSMGLKIALLSDFPPEQKGNIWGIKELCDVVLGAEDAGALKPSAVPFQKMAEQLGVPAEEILYVGNSHRFDVMGAKNAGMMAAWLLYPIKGILGKKSQTAEITFWHYKQLRKILITDTSTK